MRLCENKYLRTAKRCLALGQIEEAFLALSRIPRRARNHPEFLRIKSALASILPQITEAMLVTPSLGSRVRKSIP